LTSEPPLIRALSPWPDPLSIVFSSPHGPLPADSADDDIAEDTEGRAEQPRGGADDREPRGDCGRPDATAGADGEPAADESGRGATELPRPGQGQGQPAQGEPRPQATGGTNHPKILMRKIHIPGVKKVRPPYLIFFINGDKMIILRDCLYDEKKSFF
jgi:hypothetical protein